VIRIGYNARILAHKQTRGLTRYTSQLLKSLSKYNSLELILFTDTELNQEHLKDINCAVVEFHGHSETHWNDILLPKKIKEYKIDLFHAPADRGLPIYSPCPKVVTIHNSFERNHWKELFPTLKSRLYYWKHELVNYFASDMIIAVSDTLADELIKYKIAPKSKIHRIYPAASDSFNTLEQNEDQITLNKYSINRPYILYVSGYNKNKNVDLLVNAFNESGLGNYELVIVAEKKWDYVLLNEKWNSLKCYSRIRMLEANDEELPALYRMAEFFVNPSLWESFSLQIVECFASGTPLICSNASAMPEIAGDAALYFNPTNKQELIASMNKLAGNNSMKIELKEKGERRAKLFNWDKTAEETFLLYKKLISHG
jgi:glycosyltransferase involved in cell wall biosynthesis